MKAILLISIFFSCGAFADSQVSEGTMARVKLEFEHGSRIERSQIGLLKSKYNCELLTNTGKDEFIGSSELKVAVNKDGATFTFDKTPGYHFVLQPVDLQATNAYLYGEAKYEEFMTARKFEDRLLINFATYVTTGSNSKLEEGIIYSCR